MPLKKRNCLKHDEDIKLYPDVKLEVFKNYSRKACLLECRARVIRDMCGCLPYYYPDFSRLWKMKTDCNLTGLRCLTDIFSELLFSKVPNKRKLRLLIFGKFSRGYALIWRGYAY